MINRNITNHDEKKELLKLTLDEIRENAINELIKIETEELKIQNENLKQKNKQFYQAIEKLKKLNKLDDESLKILNSLNVE